TVGAALDADAGGGEPGGYAPRLMTVGRAGTPGGGDLQGEDPWLSWRQRRAYRRWRAAPKIPGFLDDGHEAQGDLDVFLARERRRLVADAGADEKLHAVRCQAELEPRAWTGHRHLFGPHQRRPFGEAAVQVDAFWRDVDAQVVLEQLRGREDARAARRGGVTRRHHARVQCQQGPEVTHAPRSIMTPDAGPRRVEDAARDRRDPARVLHYMRRRLLAALATSAVVVLLAGVARADDRCDARVAEMRRRIDDFPARVVVPESAPQWLRSVASDLETEKRERPVDRERARAALAAWAWPQALGACRDTFTKVVEGQTTRGIGYWSDDLVRALQAGVLACRCEGVDVDALELLMLVILQRPVEQPKAPPPREWDVFPVFTLALGVSYRLNPEVR